MRKLSTSRKEPTLNQTFKIVFQPKNPDDFQGRRRFLIGAYSLHKYLGEKNAEVAISKALMNKNDRYTKLFRTKGRIDFYNK